MGPCIRPNWDSLVSFDPLWGYRRPLSAWVMPFSKWFVLGLGRIIVRTGIRQKH